MLLRSKNVRLGNTEAQDTRSREKGTRIMHPSNFDEILVDHPALKDIPLPKGEGPIKPSGVASKSDA